MEGSYIKRLCPKGRIVMPDEFGRELGPTFILTRAPESSLLLLSKHRWEFLRERWQRMPFFIGMYRTGAFEVNWINTRNSIQVPEVLRVWTGWSAGDDIAICGIGDFAIAMEMKQMNEQMRTGKWPAIDAVIASIGTR